MQAVVVRTTPAAQRTAKLLADVDRRGAVDAENLYSTAVAEHLLPYTVVEPLWVVVLPTVTDPGDPLFGTVDAAALRRAGRVETAAWLEWAEAEWSRVRKEGDQQPLYARLDHLGHIRSQAARARFIVLYTASAARTASAVLDSTLVDPPFVAQAKTYWASFETEAEADYIVAFLNSDWVGGPDSGLADSWPVRTA